MPNYFDQFDGGPVPRAQAGASPPPSPGGNHFDQFDSPAGSADLGDALHAPQAQTASGPQARPLRLGPIEVDYRDPDAVQRAYETLTSTRKDTLSGDGRPDTNESFIRGARQGAGLNFADEARGVAEASGLPSWLPGAQLVGGARLAGEYVAPGVFGHGATDRYNQTVSQERASDEAAQQANPGTYFGGEIAGSVATLPLAPVLAPVKVAEGAGVVARGAAATGNLVANGAVFGGIAGAGGAEGGIADRAGSAATGALVGAALTPALGGAASAVRGGARFVGDHVSAFTSPDRLADRVVARNVERDAANVPALADDIERANVSSAYDVVQPDGSVVQMPREVGGQGLTLADVAGPNTQSLAGQAARYPGPGRAPTRQFLEDRQVGTDTLPGQGDRISQQLGNVLSDKSAIETGETILARRKADADNLFGVAYKRSLDYTSPDGKELLSLLDRVPSQARAQANDILKISDRDGHQLIWDTSPDASGLFPLTAVPNGRQWQYIKEGLDATIAANRNPLTGQLNTLGGAVQGLKTEILSKLDALNPAYKAARNQFAGESELLDALRLGADAFKPGTSPETVQRAIAGMTKGEQEMYRLGAANALRDKMGNQVDGADKVRTAFGTPATRAKITAMARDDAARGEFVQHLTNEGAMYATRQRATGGSPTAERLDEAADTGDIIASGLRLAKDAASGHVGSIIAEAARHLSKVNPELRGKVLNEVRKIVLNPDPDAARAFVARVNGSGLKDGTRQRIIATVKNGLGAGTPRAIATSSTGP